MHDFLLRFFLLHSVLFFFLPQPLLADETQETPRYELAISFDLPSATMSGTAHISIPPQQDTTFSIQSIAVTGILLNRNGEETLSMESPHEQRLVVPQSTEWQEIYISFTKKVERSYSNRIQENGIVLTSDWYPQPDKEMLYTVKASIPKGFTAISESDNFSPASMSGQASFHLSRPQWGIHFIAAPYTVNNLKVRDGLNLYTLFLDETLAEEYLDAAASHIHQYEAEIGPFPYNHYAIVENHLPTGYGMSTFTLLGQAVIRLPFIKDTSLRHEVLHSWFGNSVRVDDHSSNWCEGLTTYLADVAYREEKDQGVESRKESIQKYLNYVSEKSAIPLSEFNSASHFQPMADAIRTVGYNRGAMFFHELKILLGQETFSKGIQHFYTSYSRKNATWEDIQKNFENISGKDLSHFFTERLFRKDIPDISLEDITTTSTAKGTILSFNLVQKTATPFTFNAELLVSTADKKIPFSQPISQLKTPITLTIPTPPLSITFDPKHNMLRHLHSNENPPIWSRFLGSEKGLIILSSEEDRAIYQPLIKKFTKENWTIITFDKVKNSDLTSSDLLFLGTDNSVSRSLFALPDYPTTGFTLDVRNNPLNKSHVAVLISSDTKEETIKVKHRLSHYGNYSYLHFQDGKIASKSRQASENGQIYLLEHLPMGIATTALSSFHASVESLRENQVIYIGETHTSWADHQLQFRIIQALYAHNADLVIGMEMFPKSSQPALDDYLFGKEEMDEATFLKKSHYFDVWRYDWRFFRDIFTFAKNNQIPVVGLNLDRSIVSHVFKKGSTEGLSEEILNTLPKDRDLSIQGYQQRLSTVHGHHVQGGHGKGMIGGFIQAQALWDESMAENIVDYLNRHPQTQMVVLAGSQHTRKDSGIPPRVTRRLKIPQVSVLNIHAGTNVADITHLADYIFMSEDIYFPEAAKIGVVLDSIKEGETGYMQIIQLSPQGKAGKAGLQEKDIILTIDGHPIHDLEDIQISMIDAKAGSKIPLTIRRQKDESATEDKVIEVELYSPKRVKPHP